MPKYSFIVHTLLLIVLEYRCPCIYGLLLCKRMATFAYAAKYVYVCFEQCSTLLRAVCAATFSIPQVGFVA